MNPATTRTSTDRDRAVDRIRHLTVGTAVAGIVAVGGFGGLAAMSYRGADTTVTTAAATTTTTSGATATSDDSPSAGSDDSTSTSSTTSSSSTTVTTPTVTSTTGTAHATSGGS